MQHFLDTYRQLTLDSLFRLGDIYDTEIHFIDPVHEVRGINELTHYFSSLYENLKQIDFQFHNPVRVGNEGYVHWEMRYSHPGIAGGRMISVHGASYLRFTADDKVLYHRDFFDLGSMVYQHLPLLGTIVRTVNRRLRS